MTNILIVDDHYLIRAGLKKILGPEEDMQIIGELQKGAEVCKFVTQNHCDLIILDINLPDRNGLDVLKDVKAIQPDIFVLMQSIMPEEQYAIRTLRSGASGYITKDSVPEELIKAIRRITQGGRYMSEQLAEKVAFDLNVSSNQTLHEKLSDREFQILLLLGSGKSVRKIAQILSLGTSTVNTYKARIFEKMNFTTVFQLVHYVVKNNLLT